MDGADGDSSPKAISQRQATGISAAAVPRRVDVRELLCGQREMILLLQETEYRLRLTSKGKLILTK